MASTRQTQAARRTVTKAQRSAASQKAIAHLPKKTRTAPGKQGGAAARRQRTGAAVPQTRADLCELARKPTCRPVQVEPRRTRPPARPEVTALAPGGMTMARRWPLIAGAVVAGIAAGKHHDEITRYLKSKQMSKGRGHPENVPAGGSYPRPGQGAPDGTGDFDSGPRGGPVSAA